MVCTFLLVQGSPRESASYQWKKDGQPISKNSSYYSGVDDDGICYIHLFSLLLHSMCYESPLTVVLMVALTGGIRL